MIITSTDYRDSCGRTTVTGVFLSETLREHTVGGYVRILYEITIEKRLRKKYLSDFTMKIQ